MTKGKERYTCNKCGMEIIPRRYSAHWTHILPSQQDRCCKSPIDGRFIQ